VGAVERLEAKIKHLRALEASYRQEVKWAEADLKREPENRRKYERMIEKSKRKAEKLLPKIRELIERRERVKARLG
jgi:hypothetical protein